MCGNNRPAGLLALAAMLAACVAVSASAGERKLPEKPFRVGIEGEPGFKMVHGLAFQLDYGIVFKIRERFSIIPRFGLQYFEYIHKQRIGPTTYTDTLTGTGLNVCGVFRYEFVKRLTIENTRYEYDAEKREFSRYYYASPLRPYVQLIAGSLTGFGGGISYYVMPQFGIGVGMDVVWNWIALADHKAGFAIIAPKAVVTFAFN